MADLDDFFAKKDRKKSKGKKFMTTEEIAKKLEETGKKPDGLKKDKPLNQGSLSLQEGDDTSTQEDEWRHFEEVQKDYTGLKIQHLKLEDSSDSENNDGESERMIEEHASGEMTPKKGPWKVVNSEGGHQASSKAHQSNQSSNPEKPLKSQYVPPPMRNQNTGGSRLRITHGNAAPDINNQDYFPTLSAAKTESGAPNKNRKPDGGVAFEEVRNSRSHSNRIDPTHRQQNLPIGNKFGALESEHS